MEDNLILQDFYRSTLIPLRYYEGGRLIYDYTTHTIQPDPITVILQYVSDNPNPLGYIVTDDHLFFGYVRTNSGTGFYALGPTTPFKANTKTVQSILKNIGAKSMSEIKLLHYLQQISSYSVEQSRHILSLLDYLVNGKSGRATHHIPVTRLTVRQELDPPKLDFIEHIDSSLEKEIISFVEYGRPDLMKECLNRLMLHSEGVPEVSHDAERAIKNIFIFSSGVLSRTALRAGLDYDTTNEMATYFITHIEEKSEYTEIIEFLRRMFMSFANAVAFIKKTPAASLTVHKIQQIISSHLYEKITPAKIAQMVSKDVAYLCRHFKKQTGKTIVTYINEIKISECKRLLSSSDKSIMEISVQLGFSSPGYMTTVFKKITGQTPDAFRKLPPDIS